MNTTLDTFVRDTQRALELFARAYREARELSTADRRLRALRSPTEWFETFAYWHQYHSLVPPGPPLAAPTPEPMQLDLPFETDKA